MNKTYRAGICSIEENGVKYMKPLFKFLSSEHANQMMEEGNIHLPRITGFRESKDNIGLTHDELEGIVDLESPPENENRPYISIRGIEDPVVPLNTPKRITVQVDNAYVYCCAYQFITKSLDWAIEDKKDECILIIDVDSFIQRISEHFKSELEFIDARDCQYDGRNYYLTNSSYRDLVEQPDNAIFVKPKEYAKQLETRLAWRNIVKDSEVVYFRDNINVKELLIRIKYSGDPKKLKNGLGYQPRVTIITKAEFKDCSYAAASIRSVLSPIIIEKNGEKYLGFLTNQTQFNLGTFSADIFHHSTPFGLAINLVRVNKIESVCIKW